MQGPPSATPILLPLKDTRRARSWLLGKRKIDSCCRSNLPEILLVPFSCCLHKAPNLFVITPTYIQYSLQMSVRVEPLRRYTNDFQYTYVLVSTTGDCLTGCQIFQHRLALVVYRDCLHSTFQQLLYVTLMTHELVCSSYTKRSHAIWTILSEYIWMKIYGTPGSLRRSKITWLQPAEITFMEPSLVLRVGWQWICMGRQQRGTS